MSTTEEIAYNIAYQQLRSQKTDLKGFRDQAAIGAAVSGLIATVFASIVGQGAFAISAEKIGTMLGLPLAVWLVIVIFATSLGFASFTVIGWKKMNFDLNPELPLYFAEHNLDQNQLFVQLAKDANKYFDENEILLSDVKSNLTLALVFGWGQIPAWLLLL